MAYDTIKRGFTFAEMLVVIAVFSIVMVAVANSVLYFYQSNRNTVEQAYAINNARRGIEFMVRDIREVAYSDAGSYPIISMATSSFYFYSDIDRDDSVERIRYFLDGDILRKGVTNATGDPPIYNDVSEEFTIISEYVRSDVQVGNIFRYFDVNGNEITDLSAVTDVVFVRVGLVVNVNPFRLPEEFTLRSSATLRNLRVTI